MNSWIFILIIGIGATAVMDLWGVIRHRLLGITPPDYALVGRWFGHMARGRFVHKSIARSSHIAGELTIGWTVHYLTGVAFAALLVAVWGPEWILDPTIGPALTVGIGTLAAPFLLMQPGMGAGIAASRTPNPGTARLQSFITHVVFGIGLYATARITNLLFLISTTSSETLNF